MAKPMSENSTKNIADNLPEFSVGEISRAVKRTVEEAFGRVRVRGEVSRPKLHGSGHLYLRLKDEDAVIEAVCWRGTVAKLALHPEEGMEVVCTGRLTTYGGRSQYQIVIESMELAGEGALLKLLEDRRRRLAAEGLFEDARKQALPFLPEVVGVVTSPTGAVIRDILHRLDARFPRHVLLWPVAVQGEGADAQIAAAIDGFNALSAEGKVPRPDILIVGRGGGSLEDLWTFNEEAVVRAIARSEIPVISAVGHETDVTLADFAADRRAPTPSAAAEMAVPVRAELYARIVENAQRLSGALARLLDERGLRIEGLGRGLPEPARLLEDSLQRLDDRVERLDNAMRNFLGTRLAALDRAAAEIRHPREVLALAGERLDQIDLRRRRGFAALVNERTGRFDGLAAIERLGGALNRRIDDANRELDHGTALLRGLSYERVLERGFALVRGPGEVAVTASAMTQPGMDLDIRFHDGEIGARVTGGTAGVEAAKAPAPRRSRRKPDDDQGTLL